MNRATCIVLLLFVLTVFSSVSLSAGSSFPDVYTWHPQLLAASRQRALAGDTALQPALKKLRADADRELHGPLLTVTDKPDDLARSVGGKHNYASISVYFWPNEKDPKAPWVMRDGERNKDAIARFDSPRIAAMTRRVITCSQAYYFTGERTYAARAAEQLRAWFTNPDTAMTPNLEYAQCVPNKSKGSPWGIIDANQFPYMLDAVMLLQDSGEWSTDDHKALQNWFAQFTEWLYTSDLGRSERAARNNHGTFFDLLLARSAIFCGKDHIAREVVREFGKSRISAQIQPDGSTPHEQKRVDAAMYTCWNLKGMADMLLLARRLDLDLWTYTGESGQSLRHAASWLMPYVADPKSWTFGDGEFAGSSAAEFLTILAAANSDPELTTFCQAHFHAADHDKPGMEQWRASRLMLLFPF